MPKEIRTHKDGTVEVIEHPDEPLPPMTAEQWVSQHLTTMQLTALADLRVSLVLAGKPLGPKMAAMRDWTSGIIASWASDPTPKADWPLPPCSYDEAAGEAVGDLAG